MCKDHGRCVVRLEQEWISTASKLEPERFLSRYLAQSTAQDNLFSSNKRRRSSEILDMQSKHQKRILEALTPETIFSSVVDSTFTGQLESDNTFSHDSPNFLHKIQPIGLSSSNFSRHSLVMDVSSSCCEPSDLFLGCPSRSNRGILGPASKVDAVEKINEKDLKPCFWARYGDITTLLSTLDGSTKWDNSPAEGYTHMQGMQTMNAKSEVVDLEDDAVALLLKYTHVAGGT